MRTLTTSTGARPRAFALAALVAGLFAAVFGFRADDALAAYTARVVDDRVELTGDGASDTVALIATSVSVVVDVGADGTTDFEFPAGTFSALTVAAGGGNDRVSVVGNFAALAALTVDGGSGDDTILGSNGPDVLLGGGGNDVVDGQQGADTALLGSGNDRFQWDPGDGSDTVEGQGGSDALDFNGSAIGEIFEVSANGPRVRFTRNIGNIVMDLDDVESMTVRALGGADLATIEDLAGTDLKTVDVDLALVGGAGDGQVDTVVVNGTNGPDTVQVGTSGSQVRATGLFAQTRIVGSEPDVDMLLVQTLGGNDTVSVAAGVAALIVPIVDLGADE